MRGISLALSNFLFSYRPEFRPLIVQYWPLVLGPVLLPAFQVIYKAITCSAIKADKADTNLPHSHRVEFSVV